MGHRLPVLRTSFTAAHSREGRLVTQTGPAPVIEIDHVTKRFGDYVAVDDADFEIGAGEFFSMLGPSGCGKTTTLRMIAGFETPTEGAIRLQGADVSRVPPHKRNVNTVFQHYALFPHMTVWDNVAYGPRSRRTDKPTVTRQVDEMLEVLDIPSGGVERPTGGPGLVVGSFAAPDRLVHLVDPERMIHSLTRQRPPVGGRAAVS